MGVVRDRFAQMAFTKPIALRALVVVLTLGSFACHSSSPTVKLTRFAFSPDGKTLLGVLAESRTSFLYQISLDSGKAQRLTSTRSGYEGGASYSPDGKRVVYSYSENKDAHSTIMISNSDGSSVRRLTSNGNDFFPIFLRDNKTVLFGRANFFGAYSPIASPHMHEWDLYSIDDQGEHLQRLTKEALYQISPMCISADGKLLMFTSADGISIRSLASLSPPFMNLRPAVPNHPSRPVYGEAKFLPDGKNIVFLAASESSTVYDYDVYRLNIETPKAEKLTTGNGYASDLEVSPDGRTAVFVKWKLGWNRSPESGDVTLLDLTHNTTRPLKIEGLPSGQ